MLYIGDQAASPFQDDTQSKVCSEVDISKEESWTQRIAVIAVCAVLGLTLKIIL